MTLSILLVDDDEFFRGAERRLLEGEEALEIVGEAGNASEAIQLARVLHPDIVLMDIAMPDLNGLEATRQIKAAEPGTKVVMVTVHDEPGYRQAAANHGADAYVVKKCFRDDLTRVVRMVAREARRTGILRESSPRDDTSSWRKSGPCAPQ